MLTTASLANQKVDLTDPLGRDLGAITVEEEQDDLLMGTFSPGVDYGSVNQMFLEFEEAANDQAMSAVGRIQTQIDDLGLHLKPFAAAPLRVFNVQIWSDGGVSCRLRPFQPIAPVGCTVNGVAATTPTADPDRTAKTG
jgi:hypothetical protein